MSTYMYYECQDHVPALRGAEEVGQHYYDLPNIREMLRNRDKLVGSGPRNYSSHADPWAQFRGHFYLNAAAFLREHPTCNVRIMTEYGTDVTEPEEKEDT